MKTIKMPKEIGEKWLAALRDGTYKQGRGKLKDSSGNYCCLGVLQMVVSGEVEKKEFGNSEGVPSAKWLKDNKISFFTPNPTKKDVSSYPELISGSATTLNDDGMSFIDLANEIEACMEYTDENV